MRRTITVLAASAFVLGGVAVAAPAANAAKVLKPGAVTAIKVAAKTNGTATLTWKAPVVKKGKTAKATSYVVACPGQKKVTVKITKAVTKTTASQATIQCTVTAYAGKYAGPAAKSAKFAAIHIYGYTKLTLAPAIAAALNGKIGVQAPGTLTANADGSATLKFPITTSSDAASQADAWGHAGALVINGTTPAGNLAIPATKLTVVEDPNYTFDVPKFDIVGSVNGSVIPLLLLTNPEPSADNSNELDFQVNLTDNVDVIALLGTVGLNYPAGLPMGTGSSTWN